MNEEQIEKHLNRPDRKFEFHDKVTYIEKQEITVQSGAKFFNGPEAGETVKEDKSDNPLVLALMPIFKDNEDNAAEFLKAIDGKSALDITETVKKFREEKKLSAQLCHHKLWQLLNDNKIYKLTERNWNARIGY